MIRTLLLISLCASAAEAREGFFPPTAYTALAETGISAKTIAGALPVVGGFMITSKRVYPWKTVQSLLATRCGADISRAWNREFCEGLAAADCTAEGSCSVLRTSSCGGVVVSGFFVTAKHCAADLGDQTLSAKFIMPDGRPRTVLLERTALTEHGFPDDLSLLRIPDFNGESVRIRRQNPKTGEPVFGVGFPYFLMREHKRADYSAPWGDPRVVFGKVVDGNSKDHALCGFSNESDEWKDNWHWSETCPDPQQHHLFLTDTDMLNGMSGSPLFDKRGRLLGIGTNTLKKAPFDYDAEKSAIYVKAERIQFLVGKLAEVEKEIAEEAKAKHSLEKLEEAKSLEHEGRWEEAEAAFKELKSSYPDYAERADASLRFISCETGRERPRRTFPRIEYLESVTLSALSDGSRERLLDLLPCRVTLSEKESHANDLISQLLQQSINGVSPAIRSQKRIENHIEATLMGVTGDVILIWRQDPNGGWALDGASVR